ncbi:MAG: helix-turn-helix domain-containing protein [Acidobacteriota bacterium]|nr:helix-turn-helix domain-containing protein [Acidobacteriota bacterium]
MKDTGILGVKTWRLQRGISLPAIAASTRLSVRQLEAIETGDFSRLPGGLYNTSYIRQYARAIGFDEADLMAFYKEACQPPAAAKPVEARPVSFVSRLLFQH